MALNRAQQSPGERHDYSESGAVMILLAMLAIVIVMFATLIIDISAFGNQREQAEEYARLAALGALEGHFASQETTLQGQVADALARARKVSDGNVLLAERGTGGQIYSPSLQAGNGAALIPGRWELSAANGLDPCGNLGLPYPCFSPVDIAAIPAPQVTAYQVRGKIFERFSTKLATYIFNTAAFPVNVLATATVVPRRGCFIVDISASLTRDTHVLRPVADQNATPADGRGREFAFMLQADNTNEINYWDQFWNGVLAPGPNRPTNAGTGANSWKQFFTSAGSPLDIGTLTETQYQRIHFINDYVNKFVAMDSDFALFQTDYEARFNALRFPFPHPDPAAAGNAKYRINTAANTNYRHMVRVDGYRNPAGAADSAGLTYNGPQPLQTVFLGLNTAMKEFKKRQVAGDAACLMFVDSRLWYSRFVKMTENFDYIEELTNFGNPGDVIASDPATMRTAANFASGTMTGFDRLVKHGLVPIGVGSASTNLALAVNEALSELQSGNPSSMASNFITIITDGLSNCRPCKSIDTVCNDGYSCVDDYPHYRDAMINLEDLTRDDIQGKNIAMHWIMLGNAVRPNTLDVAMPDGSCMSDEQARLKNVTIVRGLDEGVDPVAAYDNKGQSPFFQPLVSAYEMAVGTKGLFGPIRPKPVNCQPAVCSSNPNGDPANMNRVFNDPLCRTPEQQITAYMKTIIGDNPYTLVEVQ